MGQLEQRRGFHTWQYPSDTELPPALAEIARRNVGKAFQAVGQLAGTDPQAAGVLLGEVRQSFVDGMHTGLRVGALVVLVGAAVLAWRLRGVDVATDHVH